MAAVVMETTKKHEKFKVLGIGWNLIEMLYGITIHTNNTEIKKSHYIIYDEVIINGESTITKD